MPPLYVWGYTLLSIALPENKQGAYFTGMFIKPLLFRQLAAFLSLC